MEACCQEGTKSVSSNLHKQQEEDQETDFFNVPDGPRSGKEECRSSTLVGRRSTEVSIKTACQRPSPQEGKDKAGHRQDAERAEKSRWVGHLATLLTGTETPLGRRLAQKPSASNTMGLGLRSHASQQGSHSSKLPFLARHFILGSLPDNRKAHSGLLGNQGPRTVHPLVCVLGRVSEISLAARLSVRPRQQPFRQVVQPDRVPNEPHVLFCGQSSFSLYVFGSICCRHGAH